MRIDRGMHLRALPGLLLVLALPWSCDSLFPWWPSNTDPSQRSLKVNLQVDAEQEDGTTGITNIVDELKRRGINATIYVTGDYANSHALLIEQFYSDGFEIAFHGKSTGEQLATMTADEQRTLLTNARQAVEGCQSCGTGKPVTGFRPQYFSQNEDTYTILDELGIAYDSGFKAGLLSIPGHENDAAPYAVTGHSFYAVPISTATLNDRRLYLCDVASVQSEHMTGQQWSDLLQAGLQEAVADNQPLVVLVHGWVTGNRDQYDYWQPFVSLLDEIQNQADFVTTQELVDLYRQ
ncbi:MAG TPA: polysaccharide deacetylase family protein [Phycisphaerae bacterium]|nr:polysaccharide deacetylase family protein [Phycisphaerae bacterium]